MQSLQKTVFAFALCQPTTPGHFAVALFCENLIGKGRRFGADEFVFRSEFFGEGVAPKKARVFVAGFHQLVCEECQGMAIKLGTELNQGNKLSKGVASVIEQANRLKFHCLLSRSGFLPSLMSNSQSPVAPLTRI